jgi:hypothetical protein
MLQSHLHSQALDTSHHQKKGLALQRKIEKKVEEQEEELNENEIK